MNCTKISRPRGRAAILSDERRRAVLLSRSSPEVFYFPLATETIAAFGFLSPATSPGTQNASGEIVAPATHRVIRQPLHQ